MREPRLKKRLGQHHLIRGDALQPLLKYLDPGGKRVLEIGSGGGALTRELARLGALVTAWEIDLSWVFALHCAGLPESVRLVAGDALAIEWSLLPAGTLVAGNLPYNIASAVLDSILSHPEAVARIAVLIQREVALRLVAAPGDSSYGALSVLTQARAQVELLGTVEPAAFRPRPRVVSAFVGLVPRPLGFSAGDGGWPQLRATVLQAFAHRRKTLINSLAIAWGRQKAATLAERAGFAPNLRAEEMGILDFARLARLEHESRAF